MSTEAPEDWALTVTADDLCLHGVEIVEGETPAQAVVRLALSSGVSLRDVGRCLALLRTGRCLLAGGAPLALLAYSPRFGVFRAVYDGECGAVMERLSPASAGVWLALLAAEFGRLPVEESDWLVARLVGDGVVTPNSALSELLARYSIARLAGDDGMPRELDAYDRLIGRAFWQCVAHCRQ